MQGYRQADYLDLPAATPCCAAKQYDNTWPATLEQALFHMHDEKGDHTWCVEHIGNGPG